jgi:uncharacterized protein YndB with AHSA1/START domain
VATESQRPTGRLAVERIIRATREQVFEAWTNPESLSRWMLPKNIAATEAQLDVRVGGKLHIVMKGDEGVREAMGEYRIVDPPSKLAFTWSSGNVGEEPTLVTVELEESGRQCHLTLTQGGFTSPDGVQQQGDDWTEIFTKLADEFEKSKKKRRKTTPTPSS